MPECRCAALAQEDIFEIVGIESVVPMLTKMLKSGGGPAQQLATQGADAHGLFKTVVVGATDGDTTGDTAALKIGTLLPLQKIGPPPTLQPLEVPEEVARLASMAGAAGQVVQNTAAALASIPAAALASGAKSVGDSLDSISNKFLAKPTEVNEFLQLNHGLWGNFLAGGNAGDATVKAQTSP